VEEFVHRVEAYFAGIPVSFEDVELDLDGWTPFQLDVVQALRRVPYGEIVSYRDLARLAGHPRAQRAAGTFCARNRYALVVPCHRVVGSDGRLVGYGGGLPMKEYLLKLEGAILG
jgi:methylated-DNA-[protein]-cysteine S-methyltransferase